jgi:hypothetical protein
MPLSRTQVGAVGEQLLAAYVTLTTDGQLELFKPLTDDDHIDMEAGRKGGLPRLAIQAKSARHPDHNGLVNALAVYRQGETRENPAFLYTVLLIADLGVGRAWLVPSADFNRLAYRRSHRGMDQLHFEAYADREDRWSPYVVQPAAVGPQLLRLADDLPAGPPPRIPGGMVLLDRAARLS